MVNDAGFERAMRAYVRVLGIADPIRLEHWDANGLTMSQVRLLYLISTSDEPSISQLAAQMRVTLPTLSGSADRLEGFGYVERLHDVEDRRVVRIRLTETGQQLLNEMAIVGRPFFRRIFDELGVEQLETLTTQLEAFAGAAEAALQDRITE